MRKYFALAMYVSTHAMGTQALPEAYFVDRDPRILPLLTKAVGHILQAQAADGGWTFHYGEGLAKVPPSETSVTLWQTHALVSAHLSGANIPGVPAALDKATQFFGSIASRDGTYAYEAGGKGGSYNSPPLGGFGSALWKPVETEHAAEWLVRDAERLERTGTGKERQPFSYTGPRADLLRWYCATYTCFFASGSSWAKWHRRCHRGLIDGQSPDGSWPPLETQSSWYEALGHSFTFEPGRTATVQFNRIWPGGRTDYPQKDAGVDGTILRTTLACLTLEAFYRYNKAAFPLGK